MHSFTTEPQYFEDIFAKMARAMLNAELVDTGHWQALTDVPQTKTLELQNTHFCMTIPATSGALASAVKPNLPWAEAHFQERVAGEPLNPGVEYRNWPWYKGNVEQHQTEEEEKFSHTYMERLWPREAEILRHPGGMQGIRYRYGDLRDVLNLLESEPTTRQAYIPMWFPEDTGAHHGGRVPCTLGYHLMMRRQRLHCFYPMRSLDLLRYFRDDVYMAGRLVQWFIEQLVKVSERWEEIVPGTLTVFASSLHVFEGDVSTLERNYR